MIKKVHSQPLHSTITKLNYQLTLLRDRNAVLSSQNQVLLSALQQLSKQLTDLKHQNQQLRINATYTKDQSVQFNNLINQRVRNLESKSDKENRDCHNVGDPLATIKSLLKNKCSPNTIASALFDIVDQSMVIGFRQSKEQEKLKKISENLQHRKNHQKKKRIETRNIIHVVKEPNYYPSSLNILYYDDIPYLFQLYEKLIIKTKKQSFKYTEIKLIFEAIRETIPLKKKVHEMFHQLKDLERQLQMGSLHPKGIEDANKILGCAQQQFETKKRQIEQQITSL